MLWMSCKEPFQRTFFCTLNFDYNYFYIITNYQIESRFIKRWQMQCKYLKEKSKIVLKKFHDWHLDVASCEEKVWKAFHKYFQKFPKISTSGCWSQSLRTAGWISRVRLFLLLLPADHLSRKFISLSSSLATPHLSFKLSQSIDICNVRRRKRRWKVE